MADGLVVVTVSYELQPVTAVYGLAVHSVQVPSVEVANEGVRLYVVESQVVHLHVAGSWVAQPVMVGHTQAPLTTVRGELHTQAPADRVKPVAHAVHAHAEL